MNNHKYLRSTLLLCLFLPLSAAAQQAKTTKSTVKWTPLQIALLNPVQLFDETRNVYGLRTSLFYGKNRNIYGLDLSLFANHARNVYGISVLGIGNELRCGFHPGFYWHKPITTTGNVWGIQVGGGGFGFLGLIILPPFGFYPIGFYAILSNRADDMTGIQVALTGNEARKLRGVQIAGFFDITEENAIGLQISGLANIAKGNGVTLQVVGFFNQTKGSFSGLQLSPIVNSSEGIYRGAQIATGNIARGVTKGLQLSLELNFSDDLAGVQITSLFNKAGGNVTGAQISLINIARGGVKGIQIGAFNYCGRLNGLQIGGLNIIWHGKIPILPGINFSHSI